MVLIASWLNIAGNLASVVGLAVALYTLYRVTTLPAALKSHSRDRQLVELIGKITRLPKSKAAVPSSTAHEVEFILLTIRTFYLSRLPFRHRHLKEYLGILDAELKGDKRREIILNQLQLIRDEITIR